MAMNDSCRDIEPLLALAVSDDLAPDERSRVDAHVQNCEACSHTLADHTHIQINLSALAESFDEHVPVIAATDGRATSVSRSLSFGMIALAVVALVFIAGMTLIRPSENPRQELVASKVNTIVEEPLASNETTQSDPIIERPVVRLIENANESDTGIVSTIYTDNPDIVIAWISD